MCILKVGPSMGPNLVTGKGILLYKKISTVQISLPIAKWMRPPPTAVIRTALGIGQLLANFNHVIVRLIKHIMGGDDFAAKTAPSCSYRLYTLHPPKIYQLQGW